MTEVRYWEGMDEAVVRDFYKVVDRDTISKKESALKQFVQAQGGDIISVNSELITKRRYKRNIAKLAKKLSK